MRCACCLDSCRLQAALWQLLQALLLRELQLCVPEQCMPLMCWPGLTVTCVCACDLGSSNPECDDWR